jgi:hypothetical protein
VIEILTDVPENVLALRASGKVTTEDYREKLIPELERRLETHDRIRVLYELGPEAEFSLGAMWEDLKADLRHLSAFERIAMVSDVRWINAATRSFAWLFPCPVRIFPTADREAALSWLRA